MARPAKEARADHYLPLNLDAYWSISFAGRAAPTLGSRSWPALIVAPYVPRDPALARPKIRTFNPHLIPSCHAKLVTAIRLIVTQCHKIKKTNHLIYGYPL